MSGNYLHAASSHFGFCAAHQGDSSDFVTLKASLNFEMDTVFVYSTQIFRILSRKYKILLVCDAHRKRLREKGGSTKRMVQKNGGTTRLVNL